MPAETLSRRALNRALLDRQLLLRRASFPAAGRQAARADAVIAAIEHLVGLQAQAPFSPYYGLWSRLAGFRPADLAELIVDRRAVRIALMRGTIHLVSARDCLMLRALIKPVLDRHLNTVLGRQLTGVDTGKLAAAGRALVEEKPRTFSELGEVMDRLRPSLRAFRDERGTELFDLPGAPRPDPDRPAPVRLVAEFDNLALAHADRTRIITDENRKRLFTRNGIFPGTVLVGGFAVGMWRISRGRGTAALTVEMFEPIRSRDRDAITREGERLLVFAAPKAEDHDIR